MIIKNKLVDRVIFIDDIPNEKIPEILRQHDILCMTIRFEGLPAASLEAMACGIPVVAANVGGLSELIINGFNGYLFEKDSPKLLAKSIEKATNEKWDYANIAKWAEENYSWKKWAQRITEIVKENIEG